MAQRVKNLPAMRETWVENILEQGMTAHPRILAWRIPMDRGAWWAIAHVVAKSQAQHRMVKMFQKVVSLFCLHPSEESLAIAVLAF